MSATAMGMGKMKRFMMGVAALAVISGCASTSISRPAEFSFDETQPSNRFAVNYKRIKALHQDFGKTADKLSKESRILNTLTVAGATATLAFTGFDAHADNIIASTLVTSVAGASATQLKPGNRAAFRVKGMLALRCIAAKADSLTALERQNERQLGAAFQVANSIGASFAVDGAGFYNMPNSSSSAYEALTTRLFLAAGIARRFDSPSPGLIAAMSRAEAARAKLALGIKAEREAFSTMSTAIDQVEAAIYGEAPPSMKGLLEAIAKVEFPSTAAPQGTAGPAGGSESLDDTEKAELARADGELIAVLEYLSDQAELLSPEQSVSLVKGMTACTASVAQ